MPPSPPTRPPRTSAAPLCAALHTPPGQGGIAVIVMTGPGAGRVLADVFRPSGRADAPDESTLRLGHVMDNDEAVDQVLARPGDVLAEIHIHGGTVVAQRVLEVLAARGVQIAGADETLADPLARPHPAWNNPAVARELLAALPAVRSAWVAAALSQQWAAGLSALACADSPDPAALERAAAALPTMRRLLAPAEVVLVGRPNAGKSTLANALTGRAVSLVHDRPGTTRDWVREIALLGPGAGVWLTDTAGLWGRAEGVDAEAVRRARQRAEEADLVVLVWAGSDADAPDAGGEIDVPHWLNAEAVLRVSAQCDRFAPAAGADVTVSAETGEGLEELDAAILARLGLADVEATEAMAFTDRQARLLREAARALRTGEDARARDRLRELLQGCR